ncbi:FkbM family methyltransferase [Desulfomonile tiedjei]|uniref:Methyltransferase, FkbM family n=1 Tax=Desulfomonile tiedjei (strain ATCC 49306 / DSM 6799 / DCB-1) TaxID=706587 RepID=I4C1Q4_DESTA|nr:FkbM family methyltransferase [Desulfomonile tiedjei]AFM23495.1 methyltransferase, FkbM family [Desulfomonile tiedjei DSM 6799]
MPITTHPHGLLFSIVNFYRTLIPESARTWIGPHLVPVLMVLCRGRIDTETYTAFLDVTDMGGRGIFFEHFRTGSWLLEPREMELFKECIRLNPESTVIDLGANYGAYTLEASCCSSDRPGPTIIAVEPNPRIFKFLAKSVAYNKLDKVMLVNAAVTDTLNKKMYLAVTPSSGSSYISASPSRRSSGLEVKGLTLDSILEERHISRTDKFIMKMDVEGSEPAALRGMARTLAESAGFQMLLEFNPPALELQGERPIDLLQSLSDLKPEIFLDLKNPRHDLVTMSDYTRFMKKVYETEGQYTNLFLSRGLRVPKSLTLLPPNSEPAIQ